MSKDAQVVVVGAGLAGLMAARQLTRAGLDVAVVEARDRVGGRTLSAPVGGAVFDLGGQWFAPYHLRVRALMDEFSLQRLPTWTQGRKVLDLDGRVSSYRGTIPKLAPWKLVGLQWAMSRLEALKEQVPTDRPWESPGAVRWDSMTVAEWVKRTARSQDACALFNAALRVVFGADCGELSMLHLLHYVTSSGGLMELIETEGAHQDARIVGGSQQLSSGLAEALDCVELGRPVVAIHTHEGGVIIETARGALRAERVVVAVPLPLCDRIVFRPPLPTLRDQLTQRVSMGATIKCFAVYERPFWREAGYSGEAVSTQGPVSVVFDNCSADGRPCLLAFVTGAPGRGWGERSAEERRRLVLGHLVRYFGEAAAEPVAYHEEDWSLSPWSGGAPIANFPPGTLSVMGPALRKPVGRIHWAGTETAREHTGFMEGALESGERVAAEVLAHFAEHSLA